MSRSDAGGEDESFLDGIISPVVVGDGGKCAWAVQFQNGIRQGIGDAELS